MKYQDLRSTIKTGDILAFTHKSWKSWYDVKVQLVRFFTQSEYSHVGIAWRANDRVFIMEAVTGGVRIVPLNKFLPCYHLSMPLLTQEQIEKAFSVMGETYSQWEAVRAFFGNIDPHNSLWECAEFVTVVANLSCKATPTAVVDYCLSSGSQLTKIE